MASGVERSDGVAVTGFASLNRVRYGLELLKWSKLIDLSRLSALQVKVPVGALLAVPADDVFLAYHLKVSPLGYPIETSAVFPRDFLNGFHNIS